MLGPFKLVGEHIIAFFTFKEKAQGIAVEGSRGISISHDWGNARYELDVHGFRLHD